MPPEGQQNQPQQPEPQIPPSSPPATPQTPSQPVAVSELPQGQPDLIPGSTKQAPKGNKLMLIGLIALVLIGGLGFLLYSMFDANGLPKGPRLFVGDRPYIYSCSVFDVDAVAKEFAINNDKNKQTVQELYSFDPANTTAKQVNLLKVTGQPNVSSTCKLSLDRQYKTEAGNRSASYTEFTVLIDQWGTSEAAKTAYNDTKTKAGAGVKSLPSFADNGIYTDSTDRGIQPAVLYNNAVIYLAIPKGKDAGQTVGNADAIMKDIIKRIDANEGRKPKDFSGISSLGKSAFVDVCQSADLAAFSKAISNDVQLEPTSFLASRTYGAEEKIDKTPSYLMSSCNFSFRLGSEIAAQDKQSKPDPKDTEAVGKYYQGNHPHYAMIQILGTASKEDAQKIVTNFKDTENMSAGRSIPKIENVKLGDLAIRFISKPGDQSPYEDYFYYIAKDSYTYLISVSLKRQSQPYQTTNLSLTDTQIGRMLDTLTAASKRAEKIKK